MGKGQVEALQGQIVPFGVQRGRKQHDAPLPHGALQQRRAAIVELHQHIRLWRGGGGPVALETHAPVRSQWQQHRMTAIHVGNQQIVTAPQTHWLIQRGRADGSEQLVEGPGVDAISRGQQQAAAVADELAKGIGLRGAQIAAGIQKHHDIVLRELCGIKLTRRAAGKHEGRLGIAADGQRQPVGLVFVPIDGWFAIDQQHANLRHHIDGEEEAVVDVEIVAANADLAAVSTGGVEHGRQAYHFLGQVSQVHRHARGLDAIQQQAHFRLIQMDAAGAAHTRQNLVFALILDELVRRAHIGQQQIAGRAIAHIHRIQMHAGRHHPAGIVATQAACLVIGHQMNGAALMA